MDIKIPNLRHLRVFLAVCHFNSTIKASEHIFLSQPAITQAIVKLEKQLATQLFERHSVGMSATHAGTIWQQRITRALSLLDDSTANIMQEYSHLNISDLEERLAKISTTQLKALIAVCETQNFSSASRHLNVSQSSTHRSARDLERLLGISLFEKSNAGIKSTPAANSLARAAKLAFNDIRQGIYEVYALQHDDISTIHVGSMPLARTAILPKAILLFGEQNPKANVKILEGTSQDLLQMLSQGDIDILLGTLSSTTDDIQQEDLWHPSLSIACNVHHTLLKKPIISAQDLAQHSWIVPLAGTSMRYVFDQIFQANDIPPPNQFVESSSHILTYELLMESDRLALVATHQLDRPLRSGTLKTLPFRLAYRHNAIGLFTRKSWLPTAAQFSFIDLIRNVVNQLKH